MATSYAYWQDLQRTPERYRAEKQRIAETVIGLLEKRFSGLRQQIEVVDVATPMTTQCPSPRCDEMWFAAFGGIGHEPEEEPRPLIRRGPDEKQWAPPGGCERPVRTRVTDRFLGFSCLENIPESSTCRSFAPSAESRAFDTSRFFRCIDLVVTNTDAGIVVSRMREWAATPKRCDWSRSLDARCQLDFRIGIRAFGARCPKPKHRLPTPAVTFCLVRGLLMAPGPLTLSVGAGRGCRSPSE
jgi:hypothetical protein